MDEPGADRIADSAVDAAEVARRRHSRHERPAGVERGAQGAFGIEACGIGRLVLDREPEVDVGVDEAGQDRPACEVDDACGRRPLLVVGPARTGVDDAPVGDLELGVGKRRSPGPVDEGGSAQEESVVTGNNGWDECRGPGVLSSVVQS